LSVSHSPQWRRTFSITARYYGGKRLADFTTGYHARRFAFAVTSDLSDDAFEITEELPGEVVASNADSAGGDFRRRLHARRHVHPASRTRQRALREARLD
jgi:hypothetical protein